MRPLSLSILLTASLALAVPARADPDFGKIVSGIAQGLLTQELERTAYQQAQGVNSAEAWRAYLTKFPQGAHKAEAEAALLRLAPAPAPLPPSAASGEARIGLSRTQRTEIQRQLTSLGYATGAADGLWGSQTRAALARWQTANRLEATGYVTSDQVALIASQTGAVVLPQTPVTDDRLEESLLGLTLVERREVQSRLVRLGYLSGGVDGVFGSNTRRAIGYWQRDGGLTASGYLTADQLRRLRSQTGG